MDRPERGFVLRGLVRPGGEQPDIPDGVVLVDARGRVDAVAPADAVDLPARLPVLGGTGAVVMPGIVDAHVHLAFAAAPGFLDLLRAGVVGVRDLGAPPGSALAWRTAPGAGAAPVVAVAGPLLTAPGGYPTRGWGRDGFGRPLTGAQDAVTAVAQLAASGVDVVKLALEPAGDQPVPAAAIARAVVEAAHAHGLAVTCHALSGTMVERGLDAGVDEFCHVPVEPLPPWLVQRLAAAGVAVVSTLQTLADGGHGQASLANARALVAAGVPLLYGTDLGNAGTRPGAEPRELERLVAAGLTPRAALGAATAGAAAAVGLRSRRADGLGGLAVGLRAAAVVLPGDPLQDFGVLRRPLAVAVGGTLLRARPRREPSSP